MNIWTILCKFVAYFTPKESLGQYAKCIAFPDAEVPSEYVISFLIFMLKCDGKNIKIKQKFVERSFIQCISFKLQKIEEISPLAVIYKQR